MEITEIARLSTVSATLLYASYLDWRYREIDDRLWVVSGSIAAALLALELYLNWNPHVATLSAISIAVTSGVAFALYFLGLYGGADAKGVSVISIGVPLYWSPGGLHPFPGLASLTNGLILSLILPAAMLLYNLTQIARGVKIFEGFEHEPAARKVLAVLFGVRLKNATKRRFWFLMEEEVGGMRRFKFNLFSLELPEISRDDVWATPGIPLLVFISAGFFYYLLIGDISYQIISGLARAAGFA